MQECVLHTQTSGQSNGPLEQEFLHMVEEVVTRTNLAHKMSTGYLTLIYRHRNSLMRARPISGATIYSVEDLKWIKKALSTTSEKVVGYYSGKLFQRLAGCAFDKELVNWFEKQRGIVTTSG